MPSSSASERVMRAVIRTLGALPEPLQRLIAGKPVEIDGQRLYTEVQMALKLLNAIPGSSFEELPLSEARAQIDAEARIFGSAPRVASIADISIPTRGGSVLARIYRADPARKIDASVVYFHGGGWVLGSLDSTDAVCRYLAAHANVAVISVDYRLAPEHPFPAGLEDAVDAYRWVRAQPELGEVVVVAGDSAGGNLSATVCAATLSEGAPDYQLLFFPVTDLATKHRSYELFSDGYFLTEKQMDWYRGHYLSDPAQATDPLVSPLYADVAGHPPAHVAVSGFDVLRDEGLAYADKLEAAGVPVTRQIATGHIHAFVNATGVGKTGLRELGTAVDIMRRAIAEIRHVRTSSLAERRSDGTSSTSE